MSAGGRARWLVRRMGVALASLLCVLLVLELAARAIRLDLVAAGENPFATYTHTAKVFELDEAQGEPVYQRTPFHWIAGPQSFPAVKAPDALRIFSLGGSAAMGWPHPPEESYAGLLGTKLRQMFPGRPIEVLNVAGNTYASYRVKVVFDEILEYDPDLVLIYSGNNEFLEEFLYNENGLGRPWNASALARFVHRRLSARAPKPEIDIQDYGSADCVTSRLSFAFGRAAKRREDPEQLRLVVEHYRYNIESMVRTARARGVAVMLLDVPVNLKDWSPNVSRHDPGLAPEALARFTRQHRAGLLALEAGDASAAAAALGEAAAIDPEFAETHFLLGRALLGLGRRDEARAAFVAALSADAYPFRSLPAFDAIRREVAARYRVPLVESVAALEREASDGILGLDVLVDYVHPRVASNEILAQEVLRAMDGAGLLAGERALEPEQCRLPVDPAVEETLPVLMGLHGQFLIMRQYDLLDGLTERLLAALQAEGRRRPLYAQTSRELEQRTREIQGIVEPYRRLLRAEKLGTLEQTFTRKEAGAIYFAYVEMIRKLEAGKWQKKDFLEFVQPLQYGRGKTDG